MPFRVNSPSRILRALLLCMMAASIGAMAILSAQIRTELRKFAEDPIDNVYWNVTQLELDSVRLQSEVELLLVQPRRPLSELRLRFDLLYSRIDTMRSGAMFERLGLHESVNPLVARLTDFLARATPLMDGGDSALQRAMPNLSSYVDDLHTDLRSMAVAVTAEYARDADQRRAGLAGLLTRIAWATSVLLAVLVALLASVSYLNRQAERQRLEAEAVSSRLRATVSTSLDAVIVAGMDGRVLDFNEAAERTFGYASAEAVGQLLEDLIVPNHHVSAHRIGMEKMRVSGKMRVVNAGRIQITAVRKSREEFPVELSIASNSGPDGMIFISYIRDISSRLVDERALLAARDDALAAEKAKTNFLAVMSHEMRTPLNGVMSALEIVRQGGSEVEKLRFLDIATSSAEQLLRHVNDVLDISKVETGNLALANEPFDLAAMIDMLAETLRPSAWVKQTDIKVAGTSGLPMVYGDSFRFGQIVQNLLLNAIKFSNRGIILIEAEQLSRQGSSLLLELRVIDTGIGIAAENQERVFDDFVMIDPSYGREAGGTGLGLAISRRLAQAMGGTLGVTSQIGKGSCFWLRLPLRIANRAADTPLPDHVHEADPSIAKYVAPAAQRGLDLLVVEDNATNRIVLEEMLKRLGHRVTLAVDGAEGVDMARQNTFDIILMDVSMPVMDGITATRLIREAGHSRASRIVAVTAHALPAEFARFRAAGMGDCLTKPIQKLDLQRILSGP